MAVLLVIGIILLVLWLLGLVGAFTLGGLIYAAFVIGLILVIAWAVTIFRSHNRYSSARRAIKKVPIRLRSHRGVRAETGF